MARTIELTNGYKTKVSNKDYRRIINAGNWYAWKGRHTFYAVRHIGPLVVGMHTFILKTKKRVDHKDQNGLNNMRNNLRVVTNSQNAMNSRIRSDNTSGVKGVHWNTKQQKWVVQYSSGGKRKSLCFTSFKAAKNARKKVELKHYGEYACR